MPFFDAGFVPLTKPTAPGPSLSVPCRDAALEGLMGTEPHGKGKAISQVIKVLS